MSIRAMLWVLDELRDLPAGPTLVMVALADYADEDGTCWPSQERIASRARASERSVRRHLTWLQAQGLVSVEHRWAQRGVGRSSRVSSVYRLPVGKVWTPAQGEPQADSAPPVSPGQPIPDNLAGMKQGDDVSAGQPIPDNLAGTGSYRTNRAFIPDTGDRYIEEPPIEPPSLPSIPTGGSADGRPGREGAAGAAVDGVELPVDRSSASDAGASVGVDEPPAGDDWLLVRSVLPESMQALPGGDVARVATALRERLAAGWSEARIRETLAARALPTKVRTLGGLVMARLRDDVPVGAAPRGGSAGGGGASGRWSVVLADGRVVEASDLDLGALAIAHTAARAEGDPRALAGRFAFAEAVGVEAFLIDPVGRPSERRGA